MLDQLYNIPAGYSCKLQCIKLQSVLLWPNEKKKKKELTRNSGKLFMDMNGI